MINHYTYPEICVCYTPILERLPSTIGSRVFSGAIGDNSDQVDINLGEGWIFNRDTLNSRSQPELSTDDSFNYVGCYEDCGERNPENKFFEFIEMSGKIIDKKVICSCVGTLPGITPNTQKFETFAAVCGPSTDRDDD